MDTFKEVFDLWIVQYEKTVEESTFVKTFGYFNDNILPVMAAYRIDKITLEICQKHYDEWATKLKKARTIKTYAKKVLDFAIIHGIIQTNPFIHMETKVKKTFTSKFDEQTENFYTREELLDFLQKSKEHVNFKVYALLRLIAYTGMRKSEALALTWSDIDFKENELSINKAIVRGKQAKLYIKTTKTGKPRTIKLDQTTMNILKEWKKTHEKNIYNLASTLLKKHSQFLVIRKTK